MKAINTRITKLETKSGTKDFIRHVIAFEGVIESPTELKGQHMSSIEHDDNYYIVNMVCG